MSGTRHSAPIYQRFQLAAEKYRNKLALVVGENCLDYLELKERVDALANGLAREGVRSGHHIGVVLPNCVEFVVTLLAGARLGAVVVPQSMGLATLAMENTFRAADIRHLIAWSGCIDNLSAGTLELTESGIRLSVGPPRSGWLSLVETMKTGEKLPASTPQLPTELPFLMVLTSGSTGEPKPILLSQKTKILRADAAAALYGTTSDDVTLAATPLYHSLAQRLVLMPLMSGGTAILMEHFTPTSWIDTVRRHSVSFSIAVSTQLKQILATLEQSAGALPSLRCLVSSSALLDEHTKGRLVSYLKCAFHECYGASEIAIATNLSPESAGIKLGSVGTAIPGTKVIILDGSGNAAPPNTIGEIACQTPMLFSGYYKKPDITAASLWGDSYFKTGDLGRLDNEGFLYFLGRIKDIIITGGVNVYPKDIEDVVASHPAVKECAAIPLLEDRLGEVVGVVVAFKDPANPPALREIQRLCMLRLGDFQQPHRFFIVSELPKNAMGKLDKPSLRRTYSTIENEA
ncbi:MAG: long-chain fatty acid--CoA ligase [Burkholderiaceae bacterium]|nr:MAG: long-chain fatty acid--CoA ligase [Burkholderiaceae bacterium]